MVEIEDKQVRRMQCRISQGHSYDLFSDGRTDGVIRSFAGTGSALKQKTYSAGTAFEHGRN